MPGQTKYWSKVANTDEEIMNALQAWWKDPARAEELHLIIPNDKEIESPMLDVEVHPLGTTDHVIIRRKEDAYPSCEPAKVRPGPVQQDPAANPEVQGVQEPHDPKGEAR